MYLDNFDSLQLLEKEIICANTINILKRNWQLLEKAQLHGIFEKIMMIINEMEVE